MESLSGHDRHNPVQHGESVAAGSTTFTDVPAGQWYTDAVTWAAANGIVGGYGDGRFSPNDSITCK